MFLCRNNRARENCFVNVSLISGQAHLKHISDEKMTVYPIKKSLKFSNSRDFYRYSIFRFINHPSLKAMLIRTLAYFS